MFSGFIRHTHALVVASTVLNGTLMLSGGTAAADPADNKFLDLLGQKDIPAFDTATSLFATGHKACTKLDGGMSVNDLEELVRNNGFNDNPLSIAGYFTPGLPQRSRVVVLVSSVFPLPTGEIPPTGPLPVPAQPPAPPEQLAPAPQQAPPPPPKHVPPAPPKQPRVEPPPQEPPPQELPPDADMPQAPAPVPAPAPAPAPASPSPEPAPPGPPGHIRLAP